jgi:preprotein translocase SecE subunit
MLRFNRAVAFYVVDEEKVKNSKQIIFIMLAIAWLIAVSIRGLIIPVLARFEVGDPTLFGLNATSIGAILLGTVSFLILNRHSKMVQFTDEVIIELNKVTWPEKDDTVRSTFVVIGLTLFIAAALASYDYVWAEVTQLVLFSDS